MLVVLLTPTLAPRPVSGGCKCRSRTTSVALIVVRDDKRALLRLDGQLCYKIEELLNRRPTRLSPGGTGRKPGRSGVPSLTNLCGVAQRLAPIAPAPAHRR
ncbi:hypothetical protein CHELA40_50615 [Chelatococcus asaccharovorans]|nr:hypothetical protein CHELA40_50615 [Chelatococcus asaccharovorans]